MNDSFCPTPQPWLTPPSTITEATSLACLAQIQQTAIAVPGFCFHPIETTYIQNGDRSPPILLLHGFDSSLLEFRRLLPLLSVDHRTMAPDLLGFGFSQRIQHLVMNPDAIKAHLWQFYQAVIQEPVILVGVSMGGAVALDFIRTYPEAVTKLILIDSAGLTDPPFASRWMFPPLDRWATNFLANANVRQSISKAAYYDKSFASLDAQACAALHLQCDGWSQSLIAFTKGGGYGSYVSVLAQIEHPSLIIWGKQDKILGTKAATQFADHLPHSQLVWIDQCGHVPHLEKAPATAEAILHFVKT